MESNPTPTIAELWREFKKICIWINYYSVDNPPQGEDVGTVPAKGWAKIPALRAQLIERCKRVPDSDGYYTEFQICEGVLDSWLCMPDGTRSKTKRQDTWATIQNLCAAYAFWAWELEQREKESTATVATTQQQPY